MTKEKNHTNNATILSKDEIELFRTTIDNTKPIKNQKNPPYRKAIKAKALFTKKDNQYVLTESLKVDINLQEENDNDILRFQRSNITPNIMKKLSRGFF